jgi:D-alanyl-D-alanine dipeptidase
VKALVIAIAVAACGSGAPAEHSGHSTGAAVDLTLVDLTAGNSAAYDPNKAYADCTAPASARVPEASVDMGTGYDCSDVRAHTARGPSRRTNAAGETCWLPPWRGKVL